MTNSFLMQLQIEHTKFTKKFQELEIKIARLLNELAVCINPYYENIEEIQTPEIIQIANELHDAKSEALEIQKKLKKISKELGE
ncbi:MAG: hypothetical protein LUE64_07285 [Candidatus Gastranaerophilales bacterium]|nr:hypothetical protein [Candidatus Gastranaerophilales bacterium]